jgi:hypothetical protein
VERLALGDFGFSILDSRFSIGRCRAGLLAGAEAPQSKIENPKSPRTGRLCNISSKNKKQTNRENREKPRNFQQVFFLPTRGPPARRQVWFRAKRQSANLRYVTPPRRQPAVARAA